MAHQMRCYILHAWASTEVYAHQRTDNLAVLIADNTEASLTKCLVDNRWKHGVKLLHDWKNASKRCEFFWFYLYLCHVLLRFMLVLNCNTKISEKSDMAKSWALGFAACHKQELFVAQELINKIKCCGIKDPIYKNHRKALSWSCGNNLQFCWLSWWLRWNINVSWNNIK